MPTPEEQGALGQAVMQRVHGDGRHQQRAQVRLLQGHADADRDQAHLADAGIGQHGLWMALMQGQKGRPEGGDQTGHDHQRAPAGQAHQPDRQGMQPAEQPGLDHRAAQHGAGGHRCDRVRQRQPQVQQGQAGLDAEAEPEQCDQQVALVGRGDGGREVGKQRLYAGISLNDGQEQPGQDQALAEYRHRQVDAPGAPGLRLVGVDHEAVGGEGHQREARVKADDVEGQDQHQVAGERQQPEKLEPGAARVVAQVAPGVEPSAPPQQGGEEQEDSGDLGQAEAGPEQDPVELQGGTGFRDQCQQQCRQRRPGGKPPDDGAQGWSRPKRRQHQWERQRQDHCGCMKRVAHGG
jgi:hypothetical protein